jgi:hypothetical protein
MIDAPMTTPPHEGSSAERGRTLRQAARITSVVGLVFAVLYIVSALVTLAVPGANATDDQIKAFYASSAATLPTIVGLYLMPLAGICFIWFIVALRMWAAAANRAPAILQSNLQLVSGIAFVILTFVAAAAGTVVSAVAQLEGGDVNTDAARQFPVFGRAVTLFFGMKMAAMYVFTTSLIGRGPKAFPDWFVYAGFVVGAFLLLSPVWSPLLVLAFPIWVIVLCVIVFRAARRLPSDVRVDDVIEGRAPARAAAASPLSGAVPRPVDAAARPVGPGAEPPAGQEPPTG